MKHTLALFSILFASIALAKPNIIVSITPQETFVKKIAKDMVDVTVMVPLGTSPHIYEPKPSQMMALSQANIYFSIGVEFEKVWLSKFQSQNSNLTFIDISAKIKKISFAQNHHHDDESHYKGIDPHTWVAPTNVAIMAQTIYKNLVKISPENTDAYKENLKVFLEEINETDIQIKSLLKNLPSQTKFMVFHPSWGYFANAYDLEQVAIEVEGKSPQPKEIIKIIKEAKEEKIRIIFTQPEFSDKSVQIIAKETNSRVEKISPLSPNWSQNLINIAEIIAK